MAGTMRPNEMTMATTPTLASASLPGGLAISTDFTKKPSAPRVDVEPLYATVKSSISDADWTAYKKSLSAFFLGNLNQSELSHSLSRILTSPALEHAHNALCAAIYANVWRDAPEPGIAAWVSSSDKPSSGVAKGVHDESEKRLKYEVMQISRRERKRLKTIPAEAADEGGRVGKEYQDARRVKRAESGPVGAGTGGFGKTNWDLEIRKRYTSSLFAETHEFPTPTTITHRLLPTCYEFGLPQGHAPDCAEYLNIATETFIKEALMSLLGKIILQSQAKASGTKKRLLCMEDLKLALMLGDGYLGQTPLIAGAIANSRCLDTVGIEHVERERQDAGINGDKRGGEVWNVQLGGDAMVLDGDEGWLGGDEGGLDDVLDEVLEFADL